jgi:hypothetical protein
MDEMPWFFVVMLWSALWCPVLLAASLFVLIVAHGASVNPESFRPGTARVLLVVGALLAVAGLPGALLWVLTL